MKPVTKSSLFSTLLFIILLLALALRDELGNRVTDSVIAGSGYLLSAIAIDFIEKSLQRGKALTTHAIQKQKLLNPSWALKLLRNGEGALVTFPGTSIPPLRLNLSADGNYFLWAKGDGDEATAATIQRYRDISLASQPTYVPYGR